jgi:ketosteroid isomerase-like protein
MSQEEVELVRETFEAWNRGDLESVLESLSPEWEWHPARLFPGTDAVYHGKEGFVRFWNTFREPWETIRVEIERIEDLGDSVLALMMFYGKGKGSGVAGCFVSPNVELVEGWRTWLEAWKPGALLRQERRRPPSSVLVDTELAEAAFTARAVQARFALVYLKTAAKSALDDVVDLEDLRLARVNTNVLEHRHEALAEGFKLLARVPDLGHA